MEGFLEECVRVLRRFKQMILQGPPGTGKTRAAKLVVAEMLEVDGEKIDSPEYRGKRWDIVQFHPSYGYEDFVRGIRVKTEKGGAIYETVDRHFGVMAKRAFDNPGDKHFLIIDEINRANVAAVLGELIYGLEYRGDKITTQYAVGENDFSLVAPKNLFVIGTMNTADRTIGHIDYAVRRRFAFRTLLPDRAVVENESGAPSALSLFDKVSALFDEKNGCMSDDFDADDVAVGHSYFLADDDDALRDKMLFQVVPILKEYLRDGVLREEARERIDEIQAAAHDLSESVDLSLENSRGEHSDSRKKYHWENRKYGSSRDVRAINRLVLSIVQDYAKHEKPATFADLQKAFPGKLGCGWIVVAIYLDEDTKIKNWVQHRRYFGREPRDRVQLPNGDVAVVTTQWTHEAGKTFIEHVEKFGYRVEDLG